MSEGAQHEIGLAEPRSVTLFEGGLTLDSGVVLGPVEVAYETYGALSPERDNVVLICHALTGSAHAAGSRPDDKRPGWWDGMIGPGKAFDTDRYFVVCPNVLGSCYGTTGPSSTDPETGRPFGLRFPVITLADMVRVQAALLDHLGIERVLAVAGGSMGGMLTLQWAAAYPERLRSAIPIATTHRHSAQQIAFNEVARQSIMADPEWKKGDYYGSRGPSLGLGVARMVGHITYMSEHSMERKFGRRLQGREQFGYDFGTVDFQVESYLQYQGRSFVERFDANSLLYLTKALDYFDLAKGHGSLTEAFAGKTVTWLLISFSSDWLYPPSNLKEVARAVRRSGADATYYEVSSDYGHDAFLIEFDKQKTLIESFLERVREEC